MKILAICGSPRKGNCETMIMEAAEGARTAGARVDVVLLRKLKFSGCCGMDQCYHKAKCLLSDDLTPILEKISKCDALILASPSYFNNVSGLMKNFIDRTNPYCKNKKWKGKKAAIIVVGGATTRSILECGRTMKDFLLIHGMCLVKTGYFMAEKPDDAEKSVEQKKTVRRLGQILTKS